MNPGDNHWLTECLLMYTGKIAIIEGDSEVTYDQLNSLVDSCKNRISSSGIKAGDRVALIGDFGLVSTALIINLIQINAIIIPLTLETARRRESLYEICDVEWEIDTYEKPTDGIFTIVRVKEPVTSAVPHLFFTEIARRNNPGLILFTSGSTGEPKAVVHDFSLLLRKFRSPGRALRTVNFLLFDHWGGLNTLLHTVTSGGTVACPTKRNPDYICSLIEKYKLELLPASPSFLNMMLVSGSHKKRDISSLKLITYGAEPMPPSTLSRVRRELPLVELRQTYGLIELGVLRAKSESSDSLLVKIGGEGYDVRVVDGLLEIKAESSMLGYLNAPSPFTEDGYFRTGDRVESHGQYFRILGRESEQINVGGEKVYPNEVEEVLMQCSIVQDAVVYGQKHLLSGNIVCADIVLLANNDDEANARVAIRQHCNETLESYKVPVKIKFVKGLLTNERQKRIRAGRGDNEDGIS